VITCNDQVQAPLEPEQLPAGNGGSIHPAAHGELFQMPTPVGTTGEPFRIPHLIAAAAIRRFGVGFLPSAVGDTVGAPSAG
jgi:hypothetical protein